MRLYYFTSQQYALESLRDKRLKLARFSELNDPFDNIGLALKRRKDRANINRFKVHHNKIFGLLCMSTTWHEPLLWGHYADKHKGICLGFDVDPDWWHKVDYQEERISLESLGRASVDHINASDFLKIGITKFKAWEYEREYRAFAKLTEADPVSGIYWHPFSDALTLREVIVGERSNASRATISGLCAGMSDDIRQIKARSSFREFKVVEQKNANIWK